MKVSNKELEALIGDEGIKIIGFRKHSKASELYVDVMFIQDDGFGWKTSIPYYYRRTGTFIETPEDLAEYLREIKILFSSQAIEKFRAQEIKRWNEDMNGKQTTKGFFDVLINLEWCSVKHDLPNNPNWARRVQDIKEFGYTLATDTNRKVSGKEENDTHLLLVPLPKGGATGYEVMSEEFKKNAIKVLSSINAYENKIGNTHGLLPDHKFPEIRWDEETRAENPSDMLPEEIRMKFQLIDNQRNQQKREVCRSCFQTGIRGTLFGLNYFYDGNENWPSSIPKTGKLAETGCVGCGWYDIQKWRDSLNNQIDELKK